MEHYTYIPEGVCAWQIDFDLRDGLLHNVRFAGGCPGNLSAIGKLLEGMEAERAVRLLRGNRCGGKETSCADQLALAVEQAARNPALAL